MDMFNDVSLELKENILSLIEEKDKVVFSEIEVPYDHFIDNHIVKQVYQDDETREEAIEYVVVETESGDIINLEQTEIIETPKTCKFHVKGKINEQVDEKIKNAYYIQILRKRGGDKYELFEMVLKVHLV